MRLRATVRGRVQGVGFRWFVQENARQLELSGWVRNADDGSVELEVEGSEAAVARFRGMIARGPRGARVDAIDELTPGADPLDHPFRIAR
jgi:acylphosphatase